MVVIRKFFFVYGNGFGYGNLKIFKNHIMTDLADKVCQ